MVLIDKLSGPAVGAETGNWGSIPSGMHYVRDGLPGWKLGVIYPGISHPLEGWYSIGHALYVGSLPSLDIRQWVPQCSSSSSMQHMVK